MPKWILIALAVMLAAAPARSQIPPELPDDERPPGDYDDECIPGFTIGVAPNGRVARIEIICDEEEDDTPDYDGRLNFNDNSAEAAIYCLPDSRGFDIFDINMLAEGDLAMRVTEADLDAVPTQPAENTLIKGVPGFAVYRLTSGEIQLNGPADWEGKPYVYIWDGCDPDDPRPTQP